MKRKILIILFVMIMIIGLTGCGKKSNNSSENVTKVGKLDLEVEAIDSFSENLARVKIDGKYGYLYDGGHIDLAEKIDMVTKNKINDKMINESGIDVETITEQTMTGFYNNYLNGGEEK